MAGKILHKGAIVQCTHLAPAQPDQTASRVTVSGQEVATLLPLYTVSGCPANTKCAKAQWLTGAQRVFVNNVAVVISSGSSLCSPSGATLDPRVFQQRVTAS